MKKQIILTLMATALLATAGIAQAGNSNRGHHNYQNRGYTHGNNHRNYARNEWRYNNHNYYGRSYRHGGHGYNYGHHRHHDAWKYAAGAVILGSIIHAANNRPSQTVYRTVRSAPAVDRRYRLDTDGLCVEVSLNRENQEVWTYVDSSYCY